MTRSLAAFAIAAALAGCAHIARKPPLPSSVGSSSYRMAADSDLSHYPLAPAQIAMGARLEVHTAPAYPPVMLAACPARVELPTRVIVGPDGHVSEACITQPPERQPFADAVRKAVQGWRYVPLTITQWAAEPDGTRHPVDSQIRPFSLDYVFTFRCEHGKTTVSSGSAPTAR